MRPDISRRQNHLARLVVFLASIAEGALILYALMGPARFEHAVLRGMARLGRVAPEQVAVDLPLGVSVARVDSAGMYQTAVDRERQEGAAAIPALYTPEFARQLAPTQQFWLRQAPQHLSVQAAWRLRYTDDPRRELEFGWVTSDALRGRGLDAVDTLYMIEIRDGKIASQQEELTATSQAWLDGARTIFEVGGWPTSAGRAILVGLVALAGSAWVWAKRQRAVARALSIAVLSAAPVLMILAFTLVDRTGTELSEVLPDALLYHAHAVLALSAERVGSPSEAAWQWTKAAHHAHGAPEVTETASGLTRVGAAQMPALRPTLCLLAGDGTPTGQLILQAAGVDDC